MESNHLTDGDIKKIVDQYNRKRDRETKQYHEVKKLDNDYMKENNIRAKKCSNIISYWLFVIRPDDSLIFYINHAL